MTFWLAIWCVYLLYYSYNIFIISTVLKLFKMSGVMVKLTPDTMWFHGRSKYNTWTWAFSTRNQAPQLRCITSKADLHYEYRICLPCITYMWMRLSMNKRDGAKRPRTDSTFAHSKTTHCRFLHYRYQHYMRGISCKNRSAKKIPICLPCITNSVCSMIVTQRDDCRLSLSVGWENGHERGPKTAYLTTHIS